MNKKKVKDNSSHFQKAYGFWGRSINNTCGFVFCLKSCSVKSFKYFKITLTTELLIERKHHIFTFLKCTECEESSGKNVPFININASTEC